jgi:hypothetical protein
LPSGAVRRADFQSSVFVLFPYAQGGPTSKNGRVRGVDGLLIPTPLWLTNA